ncbi:hypothetical protein WA026_012754 [Henosepilachna vigintioctopunctata]|uniref:Uncharacterized protein n=1 Tax=Henosepilachna vigintioctopunctata TaxID=420089 RepID=A0AAW1U743_9CUCU
MVEPTHIHVEIIDGFYYLHLIGSSIAQTFDEISESIPIKICSTKATEIHSIFDRYLSPSIEDSERERRKKFDIPYKISGPQQTTPNNFLQSLKIYRFKEVLVLFLVENDNLVTIIQNKKIFCFDDRRSSLKIRSFVKKYAQTYGIRNLTCQFSN